MNDAEALFASRDMLHNPYPVYAALRERSPVARLGPSGEWVVTRYDDVVEVLRTPELYSSVIHLERLQKKMEGERLAREAPMRGLVVVNNDPPDHSRLRKLVNKAFTPKAITRVESRIAGIADECIDRILEKGAFDMMHDLAFQLPVTVIAEMLGVDPSRRADFVRWTDDTVTTAWQKDRSREEEDRIIRSRREFIAFCGEMVEARRREPKDDLISELVRAEADRDVLTSREVVAMIRLLLIAGNETTTNLLGNGTLILAEHPEMQRQIQQDPSLIPAFVDEVLRYEPPVKFLLRRATRDLTLAGVAIPEGDMVMPVLASANRDPSRFPDPDRFDLTRDNRSEVTFGSGIHFCVGAQLARLEGKIVFGRIAERMLPLRPMESPSRWRPMPHLRGLVALPLHTASKVAEISS